MNLIKNIQNIIHIIKYIYNTIDFIKISKNNGIHIRFKSDLIIETPGTQLFYADKYIIIKSKSVHMNPTLYTETPTFEQIEQHCENIHNKYNIKPLFSNKLNYTNNLLTFNQGNINNGNR